MQVLHYTNAVAALRINLLLNEDDELPLTTSGAAAPSPYTDPSLPPGLVAAHGNSQATAKSDAESQRIQTSG